MAKARDTAFFCKECGYESAKWFGQCPACREWNTASEEPVAKTKTAKGKGVPVHIVSDGKNEPSKLADINTKETDRMPPRNHRRICLPPEIPPFRVCLDI